MGNDPEWRKANSERLKQEGIKIACELCGKVFTVNKSKSITRTHCSQKCRNADPKWRKKLSEARIKYFAKEREELIPRHKANQQKSEDIMTKQIIIVPNIYIMGYKNNLLKLIERLNNSLPDNGVEKMSYVYDSVILVPRDGAFDECKSVIEKHTGFAGRDGTKHFIVVDI